MLDKERITIDITSESIAILVGSRFKIDHYALLETPQGAFENDEIVDVDKLKAAILPQISNSKVKKKLKDLYFVIRGEELILRQITLPQMKDEALKDSVQWELSQVVGDRAEEYYVDYEVIAKRAEGQEQNLEVLMVGTEREKVDKYLELGKALGFRVRIIDMCANLTARLMRSYQDIFKNGVKSIGVLDIGANYSGFSIIEKGRLMHYKYQSQGVASIADEEFASKMDYDVFVNKIDLNAQGIDDLTDGRAENFFNSLAFNYNSVIQFYSSGKVKKTLDKIYLLGSGKNIAGLKNFIEESFNTQVEFIPDFDSLRTSIKLPKKVKMEDFFYAYALMLKQDEKELNLVPPEEELAIKQQGRKKSALLIAVLVVILMVSGFVGTIGYKIMLEQRAVSLQKELDRSQALIDKEAKIDNEIAMVNQHIEIAKNVDELKSKDTDTFFKELNKLMPGDITISSFNYNSKVSITINGTGKSQPAVEEFYANLRESKDYKYCHIATINNNDGSVGFSLDITLSKSEEVLDNVEAE